MSYEAKFEINEILEIAQDAKWEHHIPVGTEVRLTRFDKTDDSWYVEAVDGEYASWVGQEDLADTFVPVTDDEVAELFGLKPKKKWRLKK